MTRPGVDVIARAAVPAAGTATLTGTWFVVGGTERGPTDQGYLVHNMTEFTALFGNRMSWSALYDALDTFFHEGGGQAYIGRAVGPAAVNGSVILEDATPAPSLTVSSNGPTSAGPISIAVVAGTAAGTYQLVVSYAGAIVEQSGDLTTAADGAAWAQTSNYVRIVATGANPPAPVASTNLVGGTDDHTSITDVQREAALALFTSDLGPGQVSVPGAITQGIYTSLLNHAASFNRVALLDGQDTADSVALGTTADTIRSTVGLTTDAMGRGGLFAPWVLVPGVTQGTTRLVPPSALVAGIVARNDLTKNQNVPAAGINGIAQWALGVDQSWTDANRATLNVKGVNVIRMLNGTVRIYGFRSVTPVTDPWVALSNARLRMAVTKDAGDIGQQYVFTQIDGRGQKIADFSGALVGMLMGYYLSNALFGATSDQAFNVDTGPAVNTVATLANNELHAVLSLKMSPFAEWVEIEIVKVGLTDSV